MEEYDRQLQAHLAAIINIDDIPQQFRLGHPVKILDSNGEKYDGVVYVIYATYLCMLDHGLPEGRYEAQTSPPEVPKDGGPWYGVLLLEGGSLYIDQKRLRAMNPVN